MLGGLVACDAGPSVAALSIRSSLSADAVSAIDVFVIAGRYVNSAEPVTCEALRARPVATFEDIEFVAFARFDARAQARFEPARGGDGLLVVVEALDATDARVGYGCADAVRLRGNQTTTVSVTVEQVP